MLDRKLYHSAAYYPELWSEEAMEQDIQYMKEAGINTVRIAEFAWADMEPNQDEISLDYFVKVIKRMHQEEIDVIMCTPTVTPPIWMTHNHPERMYVDENLHVMSHGSREHVCVNNPFYRERSRIIVEAAARATGRLPGVIAWQIHNEFNWPVKECFCQSCKEQWHEWLTARYGSIEKLNEAWGTGVWSQRYQSFEQVPQPLPTPYLHNASLVTAYRTFTREKVAEYLNEQVQILRKFSDAPITTNTNRIFYLDNELMFQNLDFAAFDEYALSDNYKEMLMNYDLWRDTKEGKPFWVMETSTGHSGSILGCGTNHPNGYVCAEAVSAYALGGGGFSYWVWRQQRSGCEQLHGCVISSWGKPAVGYKSVLEVEAARTALEPVILNSKPQQAEVAITYSDRARSFFFTETLGEVDYYRDMLLWYEWVLNTGIHRDVIFEGASLRGYKILMTPYLPYISPDYAEKAKRFVEDGGIWIIGPASGWRTEEHTIPAEAAMGKLEELAGVETVYTYPVTGTGAKGTAFGITAELGLWSPVFETRGASMLGTIEGGITPGLAFLTEHDVGKGKVVMLGSMPRGEEGVLLLQEMLKYYAGVSSVSVRTDVSKGTIVAPRTGSGGLIWIIINMDGEGGSVTLPKEGFDLVSKQPVNSGRLEVGRYEYRVISFRG